MTRTAPDLAETAAALRHAVTRFFRAMRRQSDSGLTPSQLAALAPVGRCGPLPIGALAEAEGVGAPTATKVVDKLADAGLVERGADPDDRRVALVGLTNAGRHHLDAVRARRTAWLSERLGELSDDELASIVAATEVLDRLAAPPPPAAAPPSPADASLDERP